MRCILVIALVCLGLINPITLQAQEPWIIDSQSQWESAVAQARSLKFANGLAVPQHKQAGFISVVKHYPERRKARALTFSQSPAWDNWNPVSNVGPASSKNAPVLLPVGDRDYWYFASKRGGGLGYYAWRSSDMKNWKEIGKVSASNWVTSAEYAKGKIYLYYDQPNDQDPHLIIGENLNGRPTWRDIGKVFSDPSHGSDAGVIRTTDGVFHLIYEDWSPINASKHSWDSPLAGHADSPDGINGFLPHEHPPPIDHRTKATGKIGFFKHPHIKEQMHYQIHEPVQNAYGDYTLIKVGSRYYLFCDFDPAVGPMRVGYWSSRSINTPFKWGGDIGMGLHPDPSIGFAEGKFYLIVQRSKYDFVSPGPWVDTIEARAGVDEDGDGRIERWTKWRSVQETYKRKSGFARIVETTPAALDLSLLPAGRGFQFEFRTTDTTHNKSKPIIDRIVMSFR